MSLFQHFFQLFIGFPFHKTDQFLECFTCHLTASCNLFSRKAQCNCRLSNQFIIKKLRTWRLSLFTCLCVRNDFHNNLHHQPDQWNPDQCHHNIKACMCICNLSGNHLNLRSLRWKHLDHICEWFDKPDKDQCTGQVKNTVCNRSSLGISWLSDTGKKCRDRCSDIVS